MPQHKLTEAQQEDLLIVDALAGIYGSPIIEGAVCSIEVHHEALREFKVVVVTERSNAAHFYIGTYNYDPGTADALEGDAMELKLVDQYGRVVVSLAFNKFMGANWRPMVSAAPVGRFRITIGDNALLFPDPIPAFP